MKISVIIPVFNSAPFLRECIESVLASTGVELEMILIDDGSTDGSGAICDEYDAVVLHTENRGAAAARNAGIARATGDFTAFVDSDDVIEPTYLSDMLRYAVRKNCDIVISGLRYFSDDIGISDFNETVDAQQGVYSRREIKKRIIDPMISGGMQNPFNRPSTGSACISLYKTALIKGVEFPPTRISEDLIFQLNALSKAQKVGKIDGFKYCYRVIDGRETRSKKYAPDLWEQQLELLDYMKKFDPDRVRARVIYQALRCAGNECSAQNKKTAGQKIARIAAILRHKRVAEALETAKKYTYRPKQRAILKLMRMRAAAVIYFYLSFRKRKGG